MRTNDHDPEEVVAFASRVCRPDADALLCSCTAWRSVEAVAELERRTGKPVVTSNQASVWASFRALGLRSALKGFGRLLQDLAA
jgi:maleate isomerase